MSEIIQENKKTNEHEFSFVENCYGIKLGWGGNGTTQAPLKRVDVFGTITSIRGMEGHSNIHKYEFKWTGGYYYINNTANELVPMLPRS